MKTIERDYDAPLGWGPELCSRVAASLFGAYGFVWGAVALMTVLGVAVGMPYGDARTLAYLLSFLLFLICFCWAFLAESALSVWLVFALGGALMTALAWLGSRALV